MQNQFHLRNNNIFSADTRRGGQNFMTVCLASLLVHGLFFVGILVVNNFDLSRPLPRAIQVDLVSFVPGPVGGQSEPESLPEPKEADDASPESVKVPTESPKKEIPAPVEKIAEPVAILKPDISLKTKPKNLKELMKVEEEKEKPVPPKPPPKVAEKPKIDPEAERKKAQEKQAKKQEEENQNQISKALSRMKAAVETKSDVSSGGAKHQGVGSGAGTGLGKQGYSPLDLYKLALQSAIEQNWVFNEMLARVDQYLEVRVMIKILSSGEIRDISYETKSGNRYLDESAKRAIKRANPLPKLPMGMASYDVVVSFTPKGLK